MKNILNYRNYLYERFLVSEEDVMDLFIKKVVVPTEKAFIDSVEDDNISNELRHLLDQFILEKDDIIKLYYKLLYYALKMKVEGLISEEDYDIIINNFNSIGIDSLRVMKYSDVVNIFKSYFYKLGDGRPSKERRDKLSNYLSSEVEVETRVEHSQVEVETYVDSIVDVIENVVNEKNILYDRYYFYIPPGGIVKNMLSYLKMVQNNLEVNRNKALYYSVIYNVSILDIVYLKYSFSKFSTHLKKISNALNVSFGEVFYSVEAENIDFDAVKEVLKGVVREIIIENRDDIFKIEQDQNIKKRNKMLNNEEYVYIINEIKNNYDAFLTILPKLKARKGPDRIRGIHLIFKLLKKDQMHNLRNRRVSAYITSVIVKLTILNELNFLDEDDYYEIKYAVERYNLRSSSFLVRQEEHDDNDIINGINDLLKDFTDFDSHADNIEARQLEYYDVHNEVRLRPFPFFRNVQLDAEINHIDNDDILNKEHKVILINLLNRIDSRRNKADIGTAKMLEKYFFMYLYYTDVITADQYNENISKSIAVFNYLNVKYGERLNDPHTVDQNLLLLVYSEYNTLMDNYNASKMDEYKEDIEFMRDEEKPSEEVVKEQPEEVVHNIENDNINVYTPDEETRNINRASMLRALNPFVMFSDSMYKKFNGLKHVIDNSQLFNNRAVFIYYEYLDNVFYEYLNVKKERSEIEDFFKDNEEFRNKLNEYLDEFIRALSTENKEEHNYYIKYKMLYYIYKMFYMRKNVNKVDSAVIYVFSYVKKLIMTIFGLYNRFKNSRYKRSFYNLDTEDLVNALSIAFTHKLTQYKKYNKRKNIEVVIDTPGTAGLAANEKLKYIEQFNLFKN